MTVDDSLRKILIEILDRYYLTGRYPSPYLALVTIAGHISANNGQGACDVATLTKKQIEQLVDNNLGSNAGAVKAALEVICSQGGDKEVEGALRNFSEYYLKPTPVKGGQTGPALACLQIMTSKPDLVVRVTKHKRAAVGPKLKTLIHAQPFSVSSIANLTKATEGVVQDQVSDDISASLAEMKSQMDRVLIHLEETNREGSDSGDDDEEEEELGTTGLTGAPTSSTKEKTGASPSLDLKISEPHKSVSLTKEDEQASVEAYEQAVASISSSVFGPLSKSLKATLNSIITAAVLKTQLDFQKKKGGFELDLTWINYDKAGDSLQVAGKLVTEPNFVEKKAAIMSTKRFFDLRMKALVGYILRNKEIPSLIRDDVIHLAQRLLGLNYMVRLLATMDLLSSGGNEGKWISRGAYYSQEKAKAAATIIIMEAYCALAETFGTKEALEGDPNMPWGREGVMSVSGNHITIS